MNFTHVTLTNYGPYYESHQLDLRVRNDRPIIVIHGENMRGKTSLFNAFRWCLYGEARGREGELLTDEMLFNSVALEEGAKEARVKLEFEHGGETYVATRQILADERATSFTSRFTLQVGSTVVSDNAAHRLVSDVMDERISRFFLFDGEMLREYERLLHTATSESAAVKDSIESILGVPALRVLQDDLSTLANDAYERATRQNSVEKAAERAENDYMQAQLLLAQTDQSIREIQERLVGLNSDRQAVRDELEDLQDAQVALGRIENLQTEIRQDELAIKNHREQMQDLLRTCWWLPVAGLIEGQLAEVDTGIRAASESEGALRTLHERARTLRESLDRTTCATCDQPLPASHVTPIRKQLTAVEAEIDKLSQPVSPSLVDLLGRQDRLRPFSRPPAAASLTTIELSMRSLEQRNRIRRQDIAEENAALRGHEAAEIRAKQQKLEQLSTDIGQASTAYNDSVAERERLKGVMTAAQRKLAKSAKGDDAPAVEQAVLQFLSDLFSEAVGNFRHQMRDEVQAEASRQFMELTTEGDYTGLVINDQYGLRIMDERGHVLPVRSAGAEQIVALSLIGALNRCAIRRGPVVMDTPFGRLDERHRANILRWVPTVGDQVILLVQSGEIRDAEDLAEVRHLIRDEYRITRDGSPRKSKLVAL